MRFEKHHLGRHAPCLANAPPASIFTALLFLLLCAAASCTSRSPRQDPLAQEIQNRFHGHSSDRLLSVGLDSLYSPESLYRFYEGRSYQPAWSNKTGVLPAADSLVSVLDDAVQEGLTPDDYHLAALKPLLLDNRRNQANQQLISLPNRADLDLILTDAFFMYASHLAEGKIDPDSLKPRWTVDGRQKEYSSLLEQAFVSSSIRSSLLSLLPRHTLYTDLREVLLSMEARPKKVAWGMVPSGPSMRGGDTGKRVFALKNRLWISGDLGSRSGGSSDEFDSTLVDAVRLFQSRHGLDVTAIVDSATVLELNRPLESRIEQIKANLERWRWMPHDLGLKYIRVNIPDFRLTVVDGGREAMTMKVVLGLPEWQTPVFSAQIAQVLFNSHWMAPEDIVEKELINYMKADSNYLRNNNMTLWRGSGDSLVRIEPKTIRWEEMNEKTIDFHLRQEGGPQNIMGQVKFLIPNKFNIYLHDTPYREDFTKNIRMFSHGCIRLERPFDFAAYVLSDFPDWSRERIDTVVAQNREHSLLLIHPIPVHVLYYTVWKGKDGSVQFRDDYYGLDRRLWVAMSSGLTRNVAALAKAVVAR
jgi:L,D-transpeptidase YcbB